MAENVLSQAKIGEIELKMAFFLWQGIALFTFRLVETRCLHAPPRRQMTLTI